MPEATPRPVRAAISAARRIVAAPVAVVIAIAASAGCATTVTGTGSPTAADRGAGGVSSASQTPAPTTVISLLQVAGYWRGTYECASTKAALTLLIDASSETVGDAQFRFWAFEGSAVLPGSFTITPRIDGGTLVLTAGQWIRRPAGYATVDLRADLEVRPTVLRGHVIGSGCTTFEVRRGPQSQPA